tara:strand:- start:101 stop:466 length:366 start_codon:yes stop_codon:yes gene_type:complete
MREKEKAMRFTRENLRKDGMYLTYTGPLPANAKRGFIARFKTDRRDMGPFTTFLIKNFTVEEYFDAYAADVPPLKILESKGYMSRNAKAACKREGFPVTPEGFEAAVKASWAKWDAKRKAS